jgi:hypothetical protein
MRMGYELHALDSSVPYFVRPLKRAGENDKGVQLLWQRGGEITGVIKNDARKISLHHFLVFNLNIQKY